MEKLPVDAINTALIKLPNWFYSENAIHKNLNFDTYMDGIDFVTQLAEVAEEHNHHPDIIVRWCKVGITFSTHDSGGVTEKDIALAIEVEKLLA